MVSNAYFDLDLSKARPTRNEKVDHKIKLVLIYEILVALYLIYSSGYNMWNLNSIVITNITKNPARQYVNTLSSGQHLPSCFFGIKSASFTVGSNRLLTFKHIIYWEFKKACTPLCNIPVRMTKVVMIHNDFLTKFTNG